ncbi:hypothetical protein AKI39_13050 [Bordetella sp. H567]|uniref:hypothetical protein n=1 Tax=Bordetella sp. H567 TaxID=1697043 RepID=UPI00081CB5D5|nr:hypothetical protein [Bordetella sp. H567]AOB31418.1 hypothetical protein AKI39_13050 [Bordetella sp. H567]
MTQPLVPPSRPWYREPWPWILMAGPAAALVACMFTVYLAVVRHADAPIMEGATREGLVVRRVPAAPAAAPPGAPARNAPDTLGKE